MIDRHARPIKPGFWQLSAGGASVNLDDGQMARYKAVGRFWYDETEGRLVFDTGYPRLDFVLGKIYEEYGFLGPDDAERAVPLHRNRLPLRGITPCTFRCACHRRSTVPASIAS